MVDMATGSLWETVTLTTFGSSKQIFIDLIEEAKDLSLEKEEGNTVIYTTVGSEWRR